MTRRPRTHSALSRLVDTLGGRQLKAAIDRRVRREMAATLNGPRLRALIDAEVGRQLARAVAPEVSRQVARARADELARDPNRANRNFTTDLLLGVGTRTNRTLTPPRLDNLIAEIRTLTGVDSVGWTVKQAYQSLLALESTGLGRVAGSSYNILGKLIVPPLLQPPPGPILEVGTLYGLFAPALVRQFRRAGEFRTLTVVDPFLGVQSQPGTPGGPDQTSTPVVVEVAEHNLSRGGLSETDLQVVVGYSTDEAVRARVAEQSYAVVVIDGDHSEDGVYADLWWVQDIVCPGAIVVMDDFGDPGWPGVERATRRYLADGGRLELLGTVSTSAYLRAPGPEPSAG